MSKSKILVNQFFNVTMENFYKTEEESPLPDGFKIPNKDDFILLSEVYDIEDGEYLVTSVIKKDGYSKEMTEVIGDINNTCVCLAVVKDNIVVRYKRVKMDEEVLVLGFKAIEKLGEEQ